MNARGFVTFLALAGVYATNGKAYEISTHGQITYRAYVDSRLTTDPTVLVNLGLSTLPTQKPFGSAYYDTFGTQSHLRMAIDPFESDNMPDGAAPLSISGWLMRGAIREDDWTQILVCNVFADNPQDDPYPVPPDRPRNHFFDPYKNRPLTFLGIDKGLRAPDWALGMNDSFATPGTPNLSRRNHFSVLDAREAMYRALTLRAKNQDGSYTNLGPFSAIEQELERKKYWATTFRSLGDVLHLNQDMAQPQHTRNDRHAGVCVDTITGHESVYEKYIDARARGEAAYAIDGQQVSITPLTMLLGTFYPIPAFNRYSNFWSTSPGQGSLSGDGLADYSNRSFFTAGTNLGSNDYPLPSNNPADYSSVSVAGLLPAQPNRHMNFLLRASDNLRVTTQSAYNFEFIPGNRKYSLNRFNYDDMASALIPRAVAYSAGLINYFFRGKLEITAPDNKVYAVIDHGVPSGNVAVAGGFRRIRAKVRNLTPNINDGTGAFPQDMSGGRLEAVVKFHRNLCYASDLSGEYGAPGRTPQDSFANCRNLAEEIVVSTATLDAAGAPVNNVVLNSNEQKLFQFQFSGAPIPIDATDIYLQIVYRGALGSEADAVVVATKDISEPNYIQIHNITDYAACIGGVWYRNDADGSLSQEEINQITARGEDLAAFAPSPFARVVISLKDTITPLTAPLIEKTDLQPREFIRFAFLTDDDDPLAQSTYIAGLNVEGYDGLIFSWYNAANERVFDQNGAAVDAYMAIYSLRGTLGTLYSGAYKRGSGPACDASFSSVLFSAGFNQNPTAAALVPLSVIHESP